MSSNFRSPEPATAPLYLVFDIRDCYKNEAEAKTAAKKLAGADEGYVFCLKLAAPEALRPLLLAGDIPGLDDPEEK